MYDVSTSDVTSLGSTNVPWYGPIQVPSGIICFVRTPFLKAQVTEGHISSSSGHDFTAALLAFLSLLSVHFEDPFCKAFSQFSAVLDSRTSLRIYKHLNRLSYVKEYGAELIVFRWEKTWASVEYGSLKHGSFSIARISLWMISVNSQTMYRETDFPFVCAQRWEMSSAAYLVENLSRKGQYNVPFNFLSFF